ncbi:MAG: phosphoglycerate kinase [Candidatus Hermodarchaeota archaeon]
MRKKTIKDIDLKGKKVIMRADFNVPLDENLIITDDLRIKAALPTITYILEQDASVILMSHLGRPEGRDEKLSLRPVYQKLRELLANKAKKVDMAPDCRGPEIKNLADSLKAKEVLLLENLRFYKEEKKNESDFAKELASFAELYVNDAFGAAHRAHASTEGITKFLPSVAGFLLEKEIKYLQMVVESPEKPFVAILGGAKVSDKIMVIERLLNKVDSLLIGGGMAFTFLAAQGKEIGKSIVEKEKIEEANHLLELAKVKQKELILPVDLIIGDKFDKSANSKIVSVDDIPPNWMGMDIGPRSVELFKEKIRKAKTCLWNGPVGVFEFSAFAKGTEALAKELAKTSCTSIIGGGDSAAAFRKLGLDKQMSHVSTGGGAALELLEGKKLPGVEALDDK